MLIDPKCEHLITDFEDIVPDEHGQPKKDPKGAWHLSHCSDALGYWCEKVHSVHKRRVLERPLM